MKIAIIGAHGTGKSTLSKEIAESLGFNLISDVVPDAFRLKFLINENTPPETQFWILSKMLELERNTPENWVMEKSLWDNIIYGSFSIKDTKIIKVIKDIVIKNVYYDLVFYCPIEFPIEDDGLRSLNVDFQKTVDQELRKLLKKLKIKFYEVSGNRKKRLEKALLIIDKFTKELDN
jgi:nicotinamide riboside kinase